MVEPKALTAAAAAAATPVEMAMTPEEAMVVAPTMRDPINPTQVGRTPVMAMSILINCERIGCLLHQVLLEAKLVSENGGYNRTI